MNSVNSSAVAPISVASTTASRGGNWHTRFSTNAFAFAATAPATKQAAKYAYAKHFAGSGSWSQID